MKDLVRVTWENQHILKRLKTTNSNYDRKKWDKDYRKYEYRRNMVSQNSGNSIVLIYVGRLKQSVESSAKAKRQQWWEIDNRPISAMIRSQSAAHFNSSMKRGRYHLCQQPEEEEQSSLKMPTIDSHFSKPFPFANAIPGETKTGDISPDSTPVRPRYLQGLHGNNDGNADFHASIDQRPSTKKQFKIMEEPESLDEDEESSGGLKIDVREAERLNTAPSGEKRRTMNN